jgi:hypothetical protein
VLFLITRAPAERNVLVIGTWQPNYVSLRWSEENFLKGRAIYKHLAPNGAKSNNVMSHFKVESADDKAKLIAKPANRLA